MKNLKFIIGMFLGIITGIALFLLVSFKPEPEAPIPQSSNKIITLNSTTDVYRLRVDNTQYIVVINRDGGTAIVKHQ